MSMLFKRIKDWATSITAFRAGDVIPVDGPSGTAKMTKDDLLAVTRDGRAEKEWFETFTETKTTTSNFATFDHKFFKGQLVIISVANTTTNTGVNFKSATADDSQTQIDSANGFMQREYVCAGDYTRVSVYNNTPGCSVTCTIYSQVDSAKNYTDNASRVVEKSLSDSDFQPYFIQPSGNDTASTTRKRTRFIYAVGGGNISVVCKGYDFRISFFNTNITGSSYIVDAARDENQNWQDGDKGLQVDVPNGAINFVVSVRRKDNGTFTSSDRPEAIVSMFGQNGYMKKIYNSSRLFEDSTSSVITTPTRIDTTSVDKKNYVAITVPSGYKARVLQCNQATTWDGNIDAGDWHTDNFVQAFYLRANFYCVQLEKTDESDISDYDYFGCKIVETDSPVYGKIVSFLGDSITTFGGSTSDPDNARYAQVGDPTYVGNRCRYPQTSLGIANGESMYTYWMRLVRYCGLKLGISESWAGSMISNTQATDSGDYGPNRCISSQTRIDHLAVNGTPDVIIVYGGTNDGYNDVAVGTFNTESPKDYTDAQIAALPVETFADACRAMMIRLQKTYPSAKIIVILPNYANSIYTPQDLDPYCDMLKEVCDYFGVKYVDIRTSGITMFNASTHLNDGIHPNKVGMQLIANAIFESGVFG